MMDREERSVICTCAINLSAQNCALRIATAFSKGMHRTVWMIIVHAVAQFSIPGTNLYDRVTVTSPNKNQASVHQAAHDH